MPLRHLSFVGYDTISYLPLNPWCTWSCLQKTGIFYHTILCSKILDFLQQHPSQHHTMFGLHCRAPGYALHSGRYPIFVGS